MAPWYVQIIVWPMVILSCYLHWTNCTNRKPEAWSVYLMSMLVISFGAIIICIGNAIAGALIVLVPIAAFAGRFMKR